MHDYTTCERTCYFFPEHTEQWLVNKAYFTRRVACEVEYELALMVLSLLLELLQV